MSSNQSVLDTSQDIDNVVFGGSLASSPVAAVAVVPNSINLEDGNHLARVSTLLDQLYGPAVSRERSDLRASKVLERYEGKEEVLVEVLQDKLSLKSCDDEVTGRAASVDRGDMDAAATAATAAILTIQSNNRKEETEDEDNEEGTEEIRAVDSATTAVPAIETKKKKKNPIRRGIRKVSKKITRTEKVTRSEVVKDEPSPEADAQGVPNDKEEEADRIKAEVVSCDEDEEGEDASINAEEVQKLKEQFDIDERIKSQLSYAMSMDSAPGMGGHEVLTIDGVQKFEGMPTNEAFEGEELSSPDRNRTPSFAPVHMVDPIAIGLLPNNDKVDEDVSFEVDLERTVKLGSLVDDNADLVIVSESLIVEEEIQEAAADVDRADPEQLQSSPDMSLSKKSRSKLRFPSFGSRKQKQYTEVLGDDTSVDNVIM